MRTNMRALSHSLNGTIHKHKNTRRTCYERVPSQLVDTYFYERPDTTRHGTVQTDRDPLYLP